MIGSGGDRIVLGYQFPPITLTTLGPLFGGPPLAPVNGGTATNNLLTLQALGPRLSNWQKTMIDKLKVLRDQERALKQNLEVAKNKKMNELKEEEERRKYLQDEYVPELRKLGQSEPKVAGIIGEGMQKFNDWLKKFSNNTGGAYRLRWTKTADDGWAVEAARVAPPAGDVAVPVVVLLYGAAAYSEVVVGGAKRKVYVRRLDARLLKTEGSDSGFRNKYYVKDDRGVFTRRVAYGAKGLANCARLFVDGVLQGKYVREGGTYDAVNPYLKEHIPTLADQTTLTTEQLLYVNQELGSGHQQRGICLASTPKLIHSNQGVTFKSDGSLDLVVNLAMVPEGAGLYNLYSQEAQVVTIGMDHKREDGNFTAESSKKHTDWSTAKNRELFLKELKLAYLTPDCQERVKKSLQSWLYVNKSAVGDAKLGKKFMDTYPKKF